MSYPAGEMEVRGQAFQLTVNDGGTWFTEYQGSSVSARTRDELYQNLMKLTKQAAARVAVPFTQMEFLRGEPVIKHGTITGIHTRNRNLLVEWEDGRKSQLDVHYGKNFAVRMSPEDEARWIALVKASGEAARQVHDFQAEHAINMQEAAQKALDEAMQEGQ
jgi:hypothetical protein